MPVRTRTRKTWPLRRVRVASPLNPSGITFSEVKRCQEVVVVLYHRCVGLQLAEKIARDGFPLGGERIGVTERFETTLLRRGGNSPGCSVLV